VCLWPLLLLLAFPFSQPTNSNNTNYWPRQHTEKKRVRRNETVAVSLRQQQNQLQAMQNTTATE